MPEDVQTLNVSGASDARRNQRSNIRSRIVVCVLPAFALSLALPAYGQTPFLLKDIDPGAGDAEPEGFLNVGGTLFFALRSFAPQLQQGGFGCSIGGVLQSGS